MLSGSIGLWAVVTRSAALSVGFPPLRAPTWARWDSGNYVTIADSGYSFRRCVDVANRTPDEFCGTVGWFPGYSYATRVVGWFGLEVYPAGRIVAWAAFLAAVCILWFGFLRYRSTTTGIAGMALMVVFPGSIYYAALFPISGLLAATLLFLVFIDRQHWALAGLCAAFAAVYYPSGWLLGVAALVLLVPYWLGPLILGGDLSVHRAESLLAPVIILLARGGQRVMVPFVGVCLPIAFLMARLYFEDLLI